MNVVINALIRLLAFLTFYISANYFPADFHDMGGVYKEYNIGNICGNAQPWLIKNIFPDKDMPFTTISRNAPIDCQ